MNTHFLHTAGGFTYPYYLAVLSALRTQQGTVTVWTADPRGKYLAVLQRFSQLRIEALPIPFPVAPPALVGKPDFWAHAHIKDYLIWVILAAHGGLCLDLDTFCLADCGDLLGDRQLMLPMDYPTAAGSTHPYNSAIVAAAYQSPLATALRDEAYHRLHRRPEEFPWGTTGPILVSEAARQFPNEITTPAFRICGGFGGTESRILWAPGTISPEIRVIHLFAQHNHEFFGDITPESISGSHRLATAVRNILSGSEIIPLPSWSVADWLKARGCHYRAMFRYLRTHDCRYILETGTNNGSNAVGMIRTSLAPETEIEYYGFDLFQPNDVATQALEMSAGYHNPPSLDTVQAAIQTATRARVTLFSGNSRGTLPRANLPLMDFIYLDGGHSLETIDSDFKCAERHLAPGGVIFLDDYFPDMRHVGCALLVDSLGPKYRVTVYPEEDRYPAAWGQLRTRLASVQLKESSHG